jgi:hypothetical protein
MAACLATSFGADCSARMILRAVVVAAMATVAESHVSKNTFGTNTKIDSQRPLAGMSSVLLALYRFVR